MKRAQLGMAFALLGMLTGHAVGQVPNRSAQPGQSGPIGQLAKPSQSSTIGLASSATITGFPTEGGGSLMPLPPKPTPSFAFEDQFNKTHRLQDFHGDILVLVYGDKASADANRALGEAIHLAFHPGAQGKQAGAKSAEPLMVRGQSKGSRTPDVHAVPVAVIGRVPSFVKSLIQNRFKAAVNDTPVWLDFDDHLKSTWGLVDGQPNLVVVDGRGRCRTKGSGKLNHAQVQQLVDTIEVLRRETLGLK